MIPRLRVLCADDAATAAEMCAALISASVRTAIVERGVASLALSGGLTPVQMFRRLADEPLSWPDVHVWQVDERAVSLRDAARTWTHVCSALLQRVPIEAGHLHPMPVESEDLAAASAEYASLLQHVVGVPPVLDVVHLGLGTDGHTASLVPGDPALEVMTEDVAATGVYQGHRRMTLTYPVINGAREIVWLVTGGEKADVLSRLCGGDATMPAGRINAARAIVVADRAAAARLDVRAGASGA